MVINMKVPRYKRFEKIALSIIVGCTIITIGLSGYRAIVEHQGYKFYGIFDNVYHWFLVISFTSANIYLFYWLVCWVNIKKSILGNVLSIAAWLASIGFAFFTFAFLMGEVLMLSYHDVEVRVNETPYIVRVHSWLDYSFEYYEKESPILIKEKPEFSGSLKKDLKGDYNDYLNDLENLHLHEY